MISRRSRALGVVCTGLALTALTATAAVPRTPALAATSTTSTATPSTAVTSTAATSTAVTTAANAELPPLDPDLFREAIGGLPSDTVTGALVRVSGPSGAWAGTGGIADVRTHRPVPADGVFRIGSGTKMFTAVVVLQLAAEHRLDLDLPVQHYLPHLLPGSYPDITVGQLLDHTSGLPVSHIDDADTDPRWFAEHRLRGWTPEQVVADAVRAPMEFAPGTQQRYNGTNYFVAGLLIEKVTGNSYASEVRRRIARPLRLAHTSAPGWADTRLRGPHAHGYVTVDGALVDVTEQSAWSWAEGGMVSSAGDLTRFVTALFRGRLLPPAQQARLFTLPDVPYTGGGVPCRIGPEAGRACFSMGLQKTTLPNGVTVWGKSGSVPGYTMAVFATRDLRRLAVYSLNPTGNRDGSEGPYVQNLAAAAFDPDLFVHRG